MNLWLIAAGLLSSAAAVVHIGCIYFGASWYRYFGAGEQMAKMADQGSIQPTIITTCIVLILAIWSFYAFSAAGVLKSLPFTRVILVLVSGIYLLRGIAGFFLINNPLGRTAEFWVWSSSICLIIALVHIIGLKQTWSTL
jgi:hypothetical protein